MRPRPRQSPATWLAWWLWWAFVLFWPLAFGLIAVGVIWLALVLGVAWLAVTGRRAGPRR